MRSILIFIALISCSTTGRTQSVFPTYTDSGTWNVLECFWSDCWTGNYHFEYDTSFCGQTYSRISFPDINYTGYFRSNSTKSHFRLNPDCGDKEYLIYDFSMNIGDTVYVGYDIDWNMGKDTNEFVLESIDTINYLGINRQRFSMLFDPMNDNFPPYATMYWIKGIGSETHPFYSFLCLQDGCEGSNYLLCYDSSGTQLYENLTFNTCDTTIVGMIDLKNEDVINVFPNPFYKKTTIEIDNVEILKIGLYSIEGRKLRNIEFKKEKNLRIEFGNELDPGLYLLKLETYDQTITQIIIKAK